MQPTLAAIVSSVLLTVLERLVLAHLVKRVGLCFATVNEELSQLATLMRDRARLQQHLPDAAVKVTLVRRAHDNALGLLHLITEVEPPVTLVSNNPILEFQY